ncbi:MAG: hypothetical protein V3S51_06865 [Dehalococcoidia bacterium]
MPKQVILLGKVFWFLITRVAILSVCIAIPLGFSWALGWLFS